MAKIAPHHDEGLKISNRVYTFGDHDAVETVGKINRRLAYRGKYWYERNRLILRSYWWPWSVAMLHRLTIS